MKKLIILFAICIACMACKKNQYRNIVKLNSNFTLDSTLSDKYNYSTDVEIDLHNTTSSYIDMPNGIGKVGSCLSLLGSTTVTCNNNLFKNYPSEYGILKYYSVSFWFKVNDMSGVAVKDLYHSSDYTPEDFIMKLKSDSLIIENTDSSVVPHKINYKSIALNPYLWNNIIIIYDVNNYNIYLNSSLIYTIGRIVTEYQYERYLMFGNDKPTVGLYMYLDELNIWNYPISQTEITNYYNSTK